MLIANYRGKSFASKIIRWLTRSPWSHSAFLFDEESERAAHQLVALGKLDMGRIPNIHKGAVIEAWTGGVRSVASISSQHEPGTRVDVFRLEQPLTFGEEKALLLSLQEEIGVRYGYWNVIRFVTKCPGRLDDTWFCSELLFQKLLEQGRRLLANTDAAEVPPDWVARGRVARVGSEVTQ